MRAFDAVFLAALWAAVCAAHSSPTVLFTPYVPVHPLDEGYFPLPSYFRRGHVETGLVQEHPVGGRFSVPAPQLHHRHHQQTQSSLFPAVRPPYLAFVAPSAALVAYVPVQRGSQGPWAVPNVFIKGQGYSTNRYVAPAVMRRLLAQDPRR